MGTGICPWCGKEVDKFIMFRGDVVGCRYCGIHAKQTNADRIRAMSDEEMAWWHKQMMEGYCPRQTSECPSDCYECWLDWLRQEAEDG